MLGVTLTKKVNSRKMLDGTGIEKVSLIQYVTPGWHKKAQFTKNARGGWYKKVPISQQVRQGWHKNDLFC